MQLLLNPLSAAIHATTGQFIDDIRADERAAEELSKHFYLHHRDDYIRALDNQLVNIKKGL